MKAATEPLATQEVRASDRFEQILGIRFFRGTATEAVELGARGGLVVAPSGTCFERFVADTEYRRAILSADIVLPDSGAMVVLWRFTRGVRLRRISGLAYLKRLLGNIAAQGARDTFWVLPHDRAQEKLLHWGKTSGLHVDLASCYVAPIYGNTVADEALVELVAQRQPRHVVIAIGAGAQEKLGWYLREQATWRPAIHCIGGALGFVTGDQVAIPEWADRFYLGWLLRLLSEPRAFVPRLWKARVLPRLLLKYGEHLPPLAEPGM